MQFDEVVTRSKVRLCHMQHFANPSFSRKFVNINATKIFFNLKPPLSPNFALGKSLIETFSDAQGKSLRIYPELCFAFRRFSRLLKIL